jgi:hypothetical protein
MKGAFKKSGVPFLPVPPFNWLLLILTDVIIRCFGGEMDNQVRTAFDGVCQVKYGSGHSIRSKQCNMLWQNLLDMQGRFSYCPQSLKPVLFSRTAPVVDDHSSPAGRVRFSMDHIGCACNARNHLLHDTSSTACRLIHFACADFSA